MRRRSDRSARGSQEMLARTVEPLEPRRLLSAAVPNVDISRMTGNQAEGSIAVDRADPSRLFSVSNIDVGDGLMVATSADGGATWSPRVIANDHDALPPACCDPSAAFDAFGNLFLAYLNSNDNAVVVLRSTDAGATFSMMGEFTGNVDQPTIVTGPGSVWLDFDRNNGVAATGASDTGLGSVGSFGPLRTIPGSTGGAFGDIAIGPAGQVMVTYQKGGGSASRVFVNVDAGGLSGAFGKPILVGPTHVSDFDYIAAQPERGIDAEVGLAYDRSAGPFAGRVYLVYTDEIPASSGNTDVFVRYSDDGGAVWSSPIRVNDDTGANSQFLPRIAIDNTTGNLAVGWYDARNDQGNGGPGDTDQLVNDDAECFATVIVPQQDGLSVAANQQISAGASSAFDANSTIDLGDYTGLDFYGGSLHPLWFDNSNSTGDNPNGALKGLNAYTATASAASFVVPSMVSLGGLADAGPVASLYGGAGVNPGFVKQGRAYTITVAYSDPNGVSLASLGSANLLVTGPKGFDAPAQFLKAKVRRGGMVLATYRLINPAGPWTASDQGTYTIELASGQVTDGRSRPSDGGTLGTFVVSTGLGARSHSGAGTGFRHHPRHPGDH